jgi:HK97 gp10 family phage protein
MSLSWRVVRNDFPRVIAGMRRELPLGVEATGTEMVEHLIPILWVDTGILRSTAEVYKEGGLRVSVGVGLNPARSGHGARAHGFYAAYQEFGTSRQRARPIVGPTAMLFETRYAQRMAEAVRKACTV